MNERPGIPGCLVTLAFCNSQSLPGICLADKELGQMDSSRMQAGIRTIRPRWVAAATVAVALGLAVGAAGLARPVAASSAPIVVEQDIPTSTPTPDMASMPGHNMADMATVTETVDAEATNEPGAADATTPALTTVVTEVAPADTAPAEVTPAPEAADVPSVAELATQVQQMQTTLDLILARLDQVSAPAAPAVQAAATPNPQTLMAEMQAIDAQMAPLMQQLQDGAQGKLTADEQAQVRAEVLALAARMQTLRGQMQAAQAGTADPAAGAAPMAGMVMPAAPAAVVPAAPAAAGGSQAQTLARIEQLLSVLQAMQAELRGQAPATDPTAGMAMPAAPAASGMAVPGMAMPTPDPMAGGMGMMGMGMGMMDDMMMMMDDMMMDMDMMMGMMDMDMPMPTPSSSMPGMTMPMATPTPDPMSSMPDM
jgi:hypothetical protein